MDGVFHSTAHERAAGLVLSDEKRRAYVFACDHLGGMRREDDLVAFAGKILQGDAYEFYRLRMQEQFGRINEEERPAEVVVVVMLLDFV